VSEPNLCPNDDSWFPAEPVALQEFSRWVAGQSANPVRYRILTGPYGSGKSCFLKQFIDATRSSPGVAPTIVRECFSDEATIHSVAQLSCKIERLYQEIKEQMGDDIQQRVLLVIDGVQRRALLKQPIALPELPGHVVCLIEVDLPENYFESTQGLEDLIFPHRREVPERFLAMPPLGKCSRVKTLVDWRARNRCLLKRHWDKIRLAAGMCADTQEDVAVQVAWETLSRRIEKSRHASLQAIEIVCREVLRRIETYQMTPVEIFNKLEELNRTPPRDIATEYLRGAVKWMNDSGISKRAVWNSLGMLALAKERISSEATVHLRGEASSGDAAVEAPDDLSVELFQNVCTSSALFLSADGKWQWIWPILKTQALEMMEQSAELNEILIALKQRVARRCRELVAKMAIDRPEETPEWNAYAVRWAARHLSDVNDKERLYVLLSDPKWLLLRIVHSSAEQAADDLVLDRSLTGELRPLANHLRVILLASASALSHTPATPGNIVANLLAQLRDRRTFKSGLGESEVDRFLERLGKLSRTVWLRRIPPYSVECDWGWRFSAAIATRENPFICARLVPGTSMLIGALRNGLIAVTRLAAEESHPEQVWATASVDEKSYGEQDDPDNPRVIDIYVLNRSAEDTCCVFVVVMSDGSMTLWGLDNMSQDDDDVCEMKPPYRLVGQGNSAATEDRSSGRVSCSMLTSRSRLVLGYSDGRWELWNLIGNFRYREASGEYCSTPGGNDLHAIAAIHCAESIFIFAGGHKGLRALRIKVQLTKDGPQVADDITLSSERAGGCVTVHEDIAVRWKQQAPESVNQIVLSSDQKMLFVLCDYRHVRVLLLSENRIEEISETPAEVKNEEGQPLLVRRPEIACLERSHCANREYRIAFISHGMDGAKIWLISFDRQLRSRDRFLQATAPLSCVTSVQSSLLPSNPEKVSSLPCMVVLTRQAGGLWWSHNTIQEDRLVTGQIGAKPMTVRMTNDIAYLLKEHKKQVYYWSLRSEDQGSPSAFDVVSRLSDVEPAEVRIYESAATMNSVASFLVVSRDGGTVDRWVIPGDQCEPQPLPAIQTTVEWPNILLPWAETNSSGEVYHRAVVSSTASQVITVYDLEKGTLLAKASYDANPDLRVVEVVVSQDRRYVGVLYRNVKNRVHRVVCLFSFQEENAAGRLILTVPAMDFPGAELLCVGDEFSGMLVATADRVVNHLLRNRNGTIQSVLKISGHGRILSLAWSRARRSFACVTADGVFTLRMSPTSAGLECQDATPFVEDQQISVVGSATADASESCLTISVDRNQLVHVWSGDKNGGFREIAVLAPSLMPTLCAISPNGNVITILDQLSNLRFYTTRPEIFVSHAWGDQVSSPGKSITAATSVVERLRVSLLRWGYRPLIDFAELDDLDRIDRFVDRAGSTDLVVILLSEKYLKSSWCIFELVSIYEKCQSYEASTNTIGVSDEEVHFETETDERIRTAFKDSAIVIEIEQTNIGQPETRSRLYEHWNRTCDSLLESTAKGMRMERIKTIKNSIAHGILEKILTWISETRHPIGMESLEVRDGQSDEEFGALRKLLLKLEGEACD
jgi:hypothetical protein